VRERHGLAGRVFSAVLGSFVRGRIHVHFESPQHGIGLMREAGFDTAVIHQPRELPGVRLLAQRPGGERVRILEARCHKPAD
jgi:hypothetical protein